MAIGMRDEMMLRGLVSWLLLGLLVFTAGIGATSAEPRTALVIGNSRYVSSPLPNPENDAADVADALRRAGFEVMLVIDAGRREMSDAIGAFGEALKNQKGIGLFFFAGHGVQIGGENYLVPVGDGFADERELKDRALKAADVVDAMAAADANLNIVILDACRDNAFGKSGTRGLSRIDSNARLFVSYSTSPGAVALDGTGRNSPYTKYLTEAIGLPDLTLEQAFKHTLKGVYKETRGEQTPWISSSFFGDFIFHATGPRAAPEADKDPKETAATPAGLQRQAMQSPQPEPSETPAALTGIYKVDGRNPNGSPYRGMVSVTQTGDRFAFKWWIGSQTFDGTGQLAGRMVVINWGDKTPVVYTFGSRGALDGEWADGSATERLTLHARASDSPVTLKEGIYRAVGYHDAGKYEGVATITRRGERYRIDWKVGKQAYHGEGTLDGNLLSVDWGSATPVVYALAADGSLKGLWNAGAGEETLTPER
jgi:hypothetical protein